MLLGAYFLAFMLPANLITSQISDLHMSCSGNPELGGEDTLSLWQLLHAPSLEEGVVDTVMRGGDTDTNAAICGALIGAVHGRGAIPSRNG